MDDGAAMVIKGPTLKLSLFSPFARKTCKRQTWTRPETPAGLGRMASGRVHRVSASQAKKTRSPQPIAVRGSGHPRRDLSFVSEPNGLGTGG